MPSQPFGGVAGLPQAAVRDGEPLGKCQIPAFGLGTQSVVLFIRGQGGLADDGDDVDEVLETCGGTSLWTVPFEDGAGLVGDVIDQ